MERIVCDFSGIQVGDTVWNYKYGNCRVIFVDEHTFNFICMDSPKPEICRLKDGSISEKENADTFWMKPFTSVPPPPKRKVRRKAWISVKIFSPHDSRTTGAFRSIGECSYIYDSVERAELHKLPDEQLIEIEVEVEE
jgi:hypothetical protein